MFDFLSKAGDSVMNSLSNVGETMGNGLSHVFEKLQDPEFQQQAGLFAAAMSNDQGRYQNALNAYDQRRQQIAAQKREDMQREQARKEKLEDLKAQREYDQSVREQGYERQDSLRMQDREWQLADQASSRAFQASQKAANNTNKPNSNIVHSGGYAYEVGKDAEGNPTYTKIGSSNGGNGGNGEDPILWGMKTEQIRPLITTMRGSINDTNLKVNRFNQAAATISEYEDAKKSYEAGIAAAKENGTYTRKLDSELKEKYLSDEKLKGWELMMAENYTKALQGGYGKVSPEDMHETVQAKNTLTRWSEDAQAWINNGSSQDKLDRISKQIKTGLDSEHRAAKEKAVEFYNQLVSNGASPDQARSITISTFQGTQMDIAGAVDEYAGKPKNSQSGSSQKPGPYANQEGKIVKDKQGNVVGRVVNGYIVKQ